MSSAVNDARRAAGRTPARRTRDGPRERANANGKGGRVPDYVLIPILLVILSLALTALLYWGGFVEERRNGRTVVR